MISEKRKIILREDDSLVSDEQSQSVWRLYLKKKNQVAYKVDQFSY